MTYNFDVEGWFERERARLEALKAKGELDDVGYDKALDELEHRADELQNRLDGSFPVGNRDFHRPDNR
jgi:hypothetical protein